MKSITQKEVYQIKGRIANAAEEFESLCQARGREDLAADLSYHLERLDRGIFRLVVMGEIKKGKSSFINALLGLGNLLPTDIDIATSTVYKIVYGPEKKVKVFFYADSDTGRVPDPVVIPESQIVDYGTEAGNPNNCKRVEFIAVEHPAELLKSGLSIVDTPGVGGLYKAHRGITWQYAPNADAIFFTLDSAETLLSEDEVLFLEELTSKITERVYFIQAKTDLVGVEQRDGWSERNRSLLLQKLPKFKEDDLRYFPISSKLKREGEKRKMPKLIEDSGYPAVETFLKDELIASKDWILCRETAQILISKCAVLRKEAAQGLQIAQAQSREKLDALEEQAQEGRKALGEWERTVFQEKQEAFTDAFRDLKVSANDSLQDVLDPQSGEITRFVEELRRQNIDASALDCEIRNFQQKLIALCSERGRETLQTFNIKLYQQIQQLCQAMETHVDVDDLSARLGTPAWGASVVMQDSLHLTHGGFETTRNAVLGAGFGSGLVGIAVSIASNFVLPGMGFVVGAIAAGIAAAGTGGIMAHKQLEARRREEALMKIEKVLRETVAQVRRVALQEFGRTMTESERRIRDLFKEVIQATRARYEKEIKQVQESRNQTQLQLKAVASGCSETIRKTEEIIGELQPMCQKA